MAQRKRYYSAQDEIDMGVLCNKCKRRSAKYHNHEVFGTYTGIRFKCKRCCHICVHFFPNSKCKELDYHGK